MNVIETQVAENIQVLPQLKQFIRPLSKDEFLQLETNILREGIRDSLILWQTTYLNYYILSGKLPEGYEPESDQEEFAQLCYILVDGHNRYSIAVKHDIGFGFEVHKFASIEDCKLFMLNVQLGRRNATPEELSYYRGLQYKNSKNGHGGSRDSSSQNENLTDNKKTIEKVAEQHQVSSATIARDEKFFEGLEFIRKYDNNLYWRILSKNIKVNKKQFYLLADALKQGFNDTDCFGEYEDNVLNYLFTSVHVFLKEKQKTSEAKNKDFWKKQEQAELFSKQEPEQEDEPDFFDKEEEEKQDFESLYKQVFKEAEYYKERTEFFKEELDKATEENNQLKQQISDIGKNITLAGLSERKKFAEFGISLLRAYSNKRHYISEFIFNEISHTYIWQEMEVFNSKKELDDRVNELKQEETIIFEN
jgi:hypothetical protein